MHKPRHSLGLLAALLAMPSPTRYNERAWSNGEGFAPAKRRADKHLRTGTYTQSDRRKARRLAQLARAS